MDVQVLVYFYLAVCGSMIVFNCVYFALYRKGDRSVLLRNRRFLSKVRKVVQDLEEGGEVSQEHLQMLTRRCGNIMNFAALDEELTGLRQEHGQAVEQYARQLRPVFVSLVPVVRRKDDIQQTHYAYRVEKYRVVQDDPIPVIVEFMLELVQSPNLYCRQNALNVLYTTGDVDAVMNAVWLLSDGRHFNHEKLLTDGLLSFRGDREELINRLLKKRKAYSPAIQLVVLNFVRFGSGNHQEAFFEILQDPKEDDEFRFSAIRYFGRYPYEPAEPVIREFAAQPEKQRWEYASIAASALASYPGQETISVLKKCLTNPNWYIRYNAAVSLERFDLTYSELSDVLSGNDRFAREVLQYRLKARQQEKEVSL